MLQALASTYGISLVVVAIALMVSTSLEASLWDVLLVRPSSTLSYIPASRHMEGMPSLEHTTRGHLMLHMGVGSKVHSSVSYRD